MSNSDKQKRGKNFKDNLETYINSLNSPKELFKFASKQYLSYEGQNPKQFYIPQEIFFQDDTVWAVYATTSLRDRFKQQLWDAHNVKLIDQRIEYALMVYPDNLTKKERELFENKAKEIEEGYIYSEIDFVLPEADFKSMLEEKAFESAGLSLGQRGDLRGRGYEQTVVKTMNNKGNLNLLLDVQDKTDTGYEFELFKKIIKATELDVSQIEKISANNDIPALPSGGSGKTDVVVNYLLFDGTVVQQKISCKRTQRNKVSVNQYSAAEIVRVLDIPKEGNLAMAIYRYQECGSRKRIQEKYGFEGLSFVEETIENELDKDRLRKLTKWVVSGYGADSPNINCADWILVKTEIDGCSEEYIFGVDEYVDLLLKEKPLQMGTPFDWTYASGQRGKSIQFKMRTTH